MKIKVITSYKPGCWEQYGKKGIESMAEQFPKEIDIVVYAEEPKPECKYDRIQWIDLNTAEPELVKFKNKHKNDPVANGELEEIEGGVRRPAELQVKGGNDKNKGSFLWAAVRFANKVFCVVNAVRNSEEYDYVVWIDGDTFSFRPIPMSFFEQLLPQDTMLTYLGRENPKLNDGGKYPECGFVGYNLKHPEMQNFINDWEKLYVTDEVFKLLEWHDSYVFWHLTKKYRKESPYQIKVNDIGYWKGVKGHHVFVNSELGEYMDHMKGKRKKIGTSTRNDLRKEPTVDYWKKAPQSL
tara:strand:+ start:2657 stop:3544 length:888 start_codon:yes stop_codon:yes gene_type:complete